MRRPSGSEGSSAELEVSVAHRTWPVMLKTNKKKLLLLFYHKCIFLTGGKKAALDVTVGLRSVSVGITDFCPRKALFFSPAAKVSNLTN